MATVAPVSEVLLRPARPMALEPRVRATSADRSPATRDVRVSWPVAPAATLMAAPVARAVLAVEAATSRLSWKAALPPARTVLVTARERVAPTRTSPRARLVRWVAVARS